MSTIYAPWRKQQVYTPWRTDKEEAVQVLPQVPAKESTKESFEMPFGISPAGVTTGMQASIEAAQQYQKLQQKIQKATPITDESGKEITVDLFPQDVGLSEAVQRGIFSVAYEGEEIVEWKPRPMYPEAKPTELKFSVDSDTGNILVLSNGKLVGEADSKTGAIDLDEAFLSGVRSSYLKTYTGGLPRTDIGGASFYVHDPIAKALTRPLVVGEKVLPAVGEVLGVIGMIGSLAIMGYQAWPVIKNLVTSGTKKAVDLFINKNAKDILMVVQRGGAGSLKERMLYKIYNYHGHYIAQRAQEIYTQQRAARVAPQAIPRLEAGLVTSTQTTNNVINAVKTGKELTTTSVQGLVATGTPTEFVSGITGVVTGVAPTIPTAMAEWETVSGKEPWQMTQREFYTDEDIIAAAGERLELTGSQFKEGDLVIDDYGENPYVYRMQYINPNDIKVNMEGDTREAVIKMPTTQKYIEWYKEGKEPPPISVVRKYQTGELQSVNRRRIIAAQEAGVTRIPAFIEIGQHQDIIKQALSEGKPVPAEVLKDYPDLVVKPTAPAVEVTAIPKAEAGMPEAKPPEVPVTPEKPAVSEKKLRQSIMATVKGKGLSETAYRKIFRDVGGKKSLRDMGTTELQKVFTAVQGARPKTIGQKKVITPKTEQEIQDVKQALIAEKKITQADYDAILRMLKLSADKYTDKTSFITETQGRNIIKAMKRKSLMGYAFVEQRINELVTDMKPPDEPPQIITAEALREPFGARFIEKIQAFTIRSYRMERILYRMDGYEDVGLWQDTFYKPVNDATTTRLGEVIEWQDKFLQFAKDNKINIGKLFSTKENFEGVVLTPAEKVGVYLHSLNPDNLRHLKVGNKFSDALIKKIVDSLTPEEMAVAKFQQDYFRENFESIAEIYKYMTGKELEPVENYFPIKIDWRADPEIDWWQLVSLADAQQFMAKWASSMIPKGFLSARTHKAVQAVGLDAMSIWWNHLELTAHYKNFAPVINDLQLIMQNPKFKYTLQNTQGRHLYQVLDKWIKQVADVNPLRATGYAEQMMRTLRVHAVTAVLGVNLITSLKQFPSFVAAMSETGVLPIMRGFFTTLAHPKETSQLMKQLSPQIYARTMEREIAEARLKAKLDKQLTRKLTAREAFMFLTTSMDRLAVNSIWRGAFDDYLIKNPHAVEEAAEYASRVIRRTQPFFSVKDLAEYYRSGEFMKVMTIFTNQLNQYWNMARFEIFGKFGAKPGAKGFGELVKRLLLGIVIPAIMIGLITRSRLPKDKEEFLEDAKDDVIRTALSSFPIFGQWLAAGFQGWSEGRGLISTELFERLQAFVYNLNEEEWDRIKLQVPELAGYIIGLPVAQPKRTIEGIIALATGETDDWLRLIYSEYTRDSAFRELVASWNSDFDAYYEQPSPRYDYREANPEVDAKLFISNKVTTLQSDKAKQIVLNLIEEHGIDVRRISGYEKVFREEAEVEEAPETTYPSTGYEPWKDSETGGFTEPSDVYTPWRQ